GRTTAAVFTGGAGGRGGAGAAEGESAAAGGSGAVISACSSAWLAASAARPDDASGGKRRGAVGVGGGFGARAGAATSRGGAAGLGGSASQTAPMIAAPAALPQAISSNQRCFGRAKERRRIGFSDEERAGALLGGGRCSSATKFSSFSSIALIAAAVYRSMVEKD